MAKLIINYPDDVPANDALGYAFKVVNIGKRGRTFLPFAIFKNRMYVTSSVTKSGTDIISIGRDTANEQR